MRKRIAAALCAVCLALLLTLAALAAAPTVAITPAFGGSVAQIGGELVVSPHEGYELVCVEINGELFYDIYRFPLSNDTHYNVRAEFRLIPPVWENPYTDVSEDAWYFEAVRFTTEHGYMTGMEAQRFSPLTGLTRAMCVTMLWRIAGAPEESAEYAFADAPGDAWYAAPLRWAASRGYVRGYDDGSFRPNARVTREELAALLYRCLGIVYGGEPETVLEPFYDDFYVSDWAKEAMSWAVETGLITGKSDRVLGPRDGSTRAEAAMLLLRCAADGLI